MASFKLEKLPQNTLKIWITIPWAQIEVQKDKVTEKAIETAEIKGFRKGKAPKELVEKTLDAQKLLESSLRDLIPLVYTQAIKELDLKPILLPQIHIEKGEIGKDWELYALTCETPEIKLNGYREGIKADLAKASIWTPEKGASKEENKNESTQKEEMLGQILQWLEKNIPVDISDLLIEEEANHMLSRLVDQLQKLGLTTESYLASKGKTAETLRAEYSQAAKENLKLEFILEAIASQENTSPTQVEIEKWLESADPQTQQLLKDPSQKASLTTSLRRRKTLDFLLSLS